MFVEQGIGFYAEIVGWLTLDMKTGLTVLNRFICLATFSNDLENIRKLNRVEDRFKVMITVFPFTQDMKAKIDLTIGKYDHETIATVQNGV